MSYLSQDQVIEGFLHGSHWLQFLMAGTPDGSIDDDNVFCLPLMFLAGLLWSLLGTLAFFILIGFFLRERFTRRWLAFSVIFPCCVFGVIYIAEKNCNPGRDSYITRMLTPGTSFSEFSLIDAFHDSYVYGPDLVPVNTQALQTVRDHAKKVTDFDDFSVSSGVIVATERTHHKYKTFLKDGHGNLWSINTYRFITTQPQEVIPQAHKDTTPVSPPTPHNSSLSEDSELRLMKDAQKDFEDIHIEFKDMK